MHNKPTIEESETIFTINDDGLFISSNGGNTWYGIEIGGAAFLRFLEAALISADKLAGGVLESRAKKADGSPVSMWDLDRGNLRSMGEYAEVWRADGHYSCKWIG